MNPITEEERPHIEAMRRAAEAGFAAVPRPDDPRLHYIRGCGDVVETYTVVSMENATAARWRAVDYYDQTRPLAPLWQKSGTVEEAITELLELPPDGTRVAPKRTVRTASGLWLPRGW